MVCWDWAGLRHKQLSRSKLVTESKREIPIRWMNMGNPFTDNIWNPKQLWIYKKVLVLERSSSLNRH